MWEKKLEKNCPSMEEWYMKASHASLCEVSKRGDKNVH